MLRVLGSSRRFDLVAVANFIAGFVRKLAVDFGVAGENGALSLLAAFAKSARNKGLIQTLHLR